MSSDSSLAKPAKSGLFAARYRLDEPIGRGAMADVYRAFDEILQRSVALKLLRPSTVEGDDHRMQRLLREARACAAFEHPNVVRVYDVGEFDGVGFIAMELLEGDSLRERITTPAPMSLRMEWLLDVARALDAAHRAGVVHRDVKPANVIVCSDGVVRLIDFGIAKPVDPAAGPNSATKGVGTPRYVSPEQWFGCVATAASDQYAWGIVAAELLNGGAFPHDGAPDEEELRRCIPALPRNWIEAIVRATALDYRDRFASMADVIHLLVVDSSLSRADTQVSPASAPEHSPSSPLLAPGYVLDGRYRIDRVVGRGGMSVVYAAEQLVLKNRVAIKVLTARATHESIARFAQEARIAATLKSPHAARLIDVATPEGRPPYLVTELLEGSDLDAVLSYRGRVPLAQAAKWILQACEALAEAHRLGIVHRDIKPGNLFVAQQADGTDSIKVLDFGLSKIARTVSSADESLSKTFSFMGSLCYVSPEQLVNTKGVDARTDIWSLAVVLYELYAGSLPFASDNPAALLLAVSKAQPISVRKWRPDAPLELEALFARSLTKDPANRFPDIESFARALAPFAEASCAPQESEDRDRERERLIPRPSAPPVSVPVHAADASAITTPRLRRRPLAVLAAGALAVATAAGIGAGMAASNARRAIEPANATAPLPPAEVTPNAPLRGYTPVSNSPNAPAASSAVGPAQALEPAGPLVIDLDGSRDAGSTNSHPPHKTPKAVGAFPRVPELPASPYEKRKDGAR